MSRFELIVLGWFAYALVSPIAAAGELRASAVPAPTSEGATFVRVTVAWKNAWRNERNFDAAWVVLRDAEDPPGAPLRLARTGASNVIGGRTAQILVANDGVGAFIAPAETMRGDASFEVLLPLADGVSVGDSVRIDAVEMVHVPGGPFDLGDDAPQTLSLGAFFQPGSGVRVRGPYRVEDESAIEVSVAPGALWYEVGNTPQYRGDRMGPIPATYPKGTRGFYVMKYETRQGDYAAFLNALPPNLQSRRFFAPTKETEDASTYSIVKEGDRFVARAPDRPCNFLSWDDSAAYLDWLGLRPLSEFEFEKAARGPQRPCAADFPWGNADVSQVERRVTRERDLMASTSDHEASLDDASKARLAASYYWVMDLSGGLWERVVSCGNPDGRAFLGSHGDGVLDRETGDATNSDWPRSGADPRLAEGIGYRGGAEYFAPEADLTNPFSAVGVRTYAAWNGADRSKTYSARGARLDPSAEVGAVVATRSKLEIELLANAGVRIDSTAESGEKRTILIDAFVREAHFGYGALDDAAFEKLLSCGPVALALTTHPHLDHFQPAAARAFADRHPETLYVSTPATIAALKEAGVPESALVYVADPKDDERVFFEHEGIKVTAVELSHGPEPRFPKNLGLLVEVHGRRILHLGDAQQLEPSFASLDLGKDPLDVALVPYWYFGAESGRAIVTQHLRPRCAIAIHIEPGKEAEVRAGVADLSARVEVLDPGTRLSIDRP